MHKVQGKRVVHISDTQPGLGVAREDAIDDVQSFDDDEDDEAEIEEPEDLIPSKIL